MPDVLAVYRQVARVTVAGGLYISQHKQPASLQAGGRAVAARLRVGRAVLSHAARLPPVAGSPHREAGTLEFLHRWEELLGGMCRAGFAIEDLLEPLHADEQAPIGSFAHRSRYVAPYVRIKARRGRSVADAARRSPAIVWMPVIAGDGRAAAAPAGHAGTSAGRCNPPRRSIKIDNTDSPPVRLLRQSTPEVSCTRVAPADPGNRGGLRPARGRKSDAIHDGKGLRRTSGLDWRYLTLEVAPTTWATPCAACGRWAFAAAI